MPPRTRPKSSPAPRAHAAPAARPAGARPAPARPGFDRAALAVMLALYCAVFFTVCVVKYRYYLYRDFDLAIFTQACARLLHGSFYSSIRGMDWIGDHSSLHLFWVAPLYALVPQALTLLFVQTLALALGAIPVYLLAKDRFGPGAIALGAAALWLLYPAVGYVNLFEFHPEALSTPALLAAVLFIQRGRARPALLWAAFALLGKEDIALVTLGLAAWAWSLRRPGDGKLAAALAGLAALSLALTFGYLKPRFASAEADYALMYRGWGSRPGEIALHMLQRPLDALRALFQTPGDATDSAAKLEYYAHLLLPLAGLPLLAPRVMLVAAPIVVEHMLSWRGAQHSIAFQYAALVAPFTIAAGVAGLARLDGAGGGSARARVAVALALALSIASQALFGPFAPHREFQHQLPNQRVWPDVEDLTLKPYRDRMLAQIPPEGGVVTSFEYLARVAGRDNVHSYHHIFLGHYTISNKPYPVPRGIAAMLTNLGDQRIPEATIRTEQLFFSNRLQPADAAGDLLLFLQHPARALPLLGPAPELRPEERARFEFDHELAFIGGRLDTIVTRPGGLVEFQTVWERLAPPTRYFFTEISFFDAAQHEMKRFSRYLGYSTSLPERFPQNSPFAERYRLVIPLDTPPGTYTLVLRVGRRIGVKQELAQSSDPGLERNGGGIALGAFEVRK